ncbi:MAG: helix-turn-helix transcriptional regulator [Chloroflexi bacterium]|nr:helix-turn-helix transcriptional regulator [Chloroflexota bacterium]
MQERSSAPDIIDVEHQTFSARLRRDRLATGLTQDALAQRAGLSVRGIADLERGMRSSPYPQTVERLVSSLGLAKADSGVLRAAAPRSRATGQRRPRSDSAPRGGGGRPRLRRGELARRSGCAAQLTGAPSGT